MTEELLSILITDKYYLYLICFFNYLEINMNRRNFTKAIAKNGHAMLGVGAAALAAIPATIKTFVAFSLPALSLS